MRQRKLGKPEVARTDDQTTLTYAVDTGDDWDTVLVSIIDSNAKRKADENGQQD